KQLLDRAPNACSAHILQRAVLWGLLRRHGNIRRATQDADETGHAHGVRQTTQAVENDTAQRLLVRQRRLALLPLPIFCRTGSSSADIAHATAVHRQPLAEVVCNQLLAADGCIGRLRISDQYSCLLLMARGELSEQLRQQGLAIGRWGKELQE